MASVAGADRFGASSSARVRVYAPLRATPTAEPENMVIEPDEEVEFFAHGGTPPYTFSVASPYAVDDHLEVDGNTAAFEPDGLTEDAYITVTDSSNPVQSVTAKLIVVEVHDPDPQPLTRIRLTDRTGKVVEVKINID